MAAERVCIGEVVVQLNGPSEELESRFVLLLQTIAVADDAPGFRGKQRFLKSLVRKVNETVLVF